VLEVHRDLFPAWSPARMPLPELWEHARVNNWRGRPVHLPAVTHILLHICIHFAWSHMMALGAWRTFSDLHAIIRRERIDWEEFCAIAVRAQAATCCFWTLRLAASLGAAPVPTEVLETLRPPGSDFVLNRLERHLGVNLLPGDRVCPSTLLFHRMWEAAIRPGWSGHGARRPWHQNPPTQGPRPSRSRRGRAHFRRLAAWRRYLAAVTSW
jgi:hypothetical protein